jgi:hypothetical protein
MDDHDILLIRSVGGLGDVLDPILVTIALAGLGDLWRSRTLLATLKSLHPVQRLAVGCQPATTTPQRRSSPAAWSRLRRPEG